MSLFFLDSSALVKRYMMETGTAWIQQLTSPGSGNRIIIAQITPIELVSTFARKKRETNISDRTLKAAMLLLERHVAREYIIAFLNPDVEKQAKTLLINHTLRSADAVQLASAQTIQHKLNIANAGSLIFVCADARLLSVAAQEGFTTEDPNSHP